MSFSRGRAVLLPMAMLALASRAGGQEPASPSDATVFIRVFGQVDECRLDQCRLVRNHFKRACLQLNWRV